MCTYYQPHISLLGYLYSQVTAEQSALQWKRSLLQSQTRSPNCGSRPAAERQREREYICREFIYTVDISRQSVKQGTAAHSLEG